MDGVPVPLGQRRWKLARPWPQTAREVVLTAIAADGTETQTRASLASLLNG